MDEDIHTGAGPGARDDVADDVAPLLHLAGRRPRLPEEEVAPLRMAAREVFRRQARRAAIRRRIGWTLASAAAVLLVALGISLRNPIGPYPGQPVATFAMRTGEVVVSGASLSAGTVVTTGKNGRAALRLTEGAALRIDAASAVRLDSPRLLTLERGAVYFDSGAVAHPGERVEIATVLGSVRDVGTRFEARLLTDGAGALRVRVREGRVLVGRAGESHEAKAGGELVLQADGSLRRAETAVYGADWDWVQRAAPALAIEGATLAEFLDWVSQETGLRWRLAEPRSGRSPADIILHGSIEGLTAEEALAVVLPGCGYRHRLDGDELWLESGPQS